MKKSIAVRRILAILLSVTAALYLVWRIVYTIPYDHGALSVVLGWVLLLTELFGAAELLIFFWLDTGARGKLPEKGVHPEVDVFVTTCGEPVSLLEKTLKGCIAMKYQGRKNIYLLDDAPTPEMRELAQVLGVSYLTREGRENAKAGNLNAALSKTHGTLIAVFDADMVPRPDFLLKTAALMTNGVAYVQTPQHFQNFDLFQKAFSGKKPIPNEQDFFYRSIEPARNASNAVILAGSNMLLRRKALQEIGGFATGTLTEDFATGIELTKRGYKTCAIAEPLADGLAPESFGALIRQRKRWATGCIQAGKRTGLLFQKGLTLSQRLSYLIAVSFWYFPIKRIVYMAMPLLFALCDLSVMRCDPLFSAIFWLPMFLLTSFGVLYSSEHTRTVGWSMLYETCLTPFLLVTVLRTTFGHGAKNFEVTDKSGRREWKALWLLPFAIAAALNAWGLIAAVQRSISEGTWLYTLLIAWIAYHLYLSLCAFLMVLSVGKNRNAGENELHTAPSNALGALLACKLIRLIRGFVKR